MLTIEDQIVKKYKGWLELWAEGQAFPDELTITTINDTEFTYCREGLPGPNRVVTTLINDPLDEGGPALVISHFYWSDDTEKWVMTMQISQFDLRWDLIWTEELGYKK